MSEKDLANAILQEEELKEKDIGEELNEKIEKDKEELMTEMLLVELDQAGTIYLDSTDKPTQREVRSIAREILEITG